MNLTLKFKRKKFISLLLTLCMVLIMAPGTEAEATEPEDITINVSTDSNRSGSDGSWNWVANSKTFTLSGDIIGDITFSGGSDAGDVRFDVDGERTVNGAITCSAGDLTITGVSTDKLTINTTDDDCIYSTYGDLEISGLTVDATTGEDGGTAVYLQSGDKTFTMSSGMLNFTATAGSNSAGIRASNAGNINLSGSARVTGTAAGSALSGTNVTVGGNAQVEVTSTGSVGISAAQRLTVEGGSVTAKGSNASSIGGGVYTNIDGQGVLVTGGTLTTGSTNNTDGSITGKLVVEGGIVTVNGNIEFSSENNLGELIVSGGTVAVTGTVENGVIVTGSGSATVGSVNYPPMTVTGVTVSPAAETVAPGSFSFFDASVEGSANVSQKVDWEVSGSTSASTTVNTYGVLMVGSDEAIGTILTVKATSRIDNTTSGTATVTVANATVAGIPITDANKDNITGAGITGASGAVSYDPSTKTLTLNNAVIAPAVVDGGKIDAITSSTDITIELIGNNVLGTPPANPADVDDYTIGSGISAQEKDIKINGSGNLTIYNHVSGIEGKNVTIDMTGTLTVQEYGTGAACCLKADGGTLTINRGNLRLSSQASNGLYGNSIVINGGTITAQTQDAEHFAFNTAPTFSSGYAHKVSAGSDAASAVEITNPDSAAFTGSKYVRIEPKPSNGGNGGGRNTVTTPTAPSTAVFGATATTTVTPTVNADGKAGAVLTSVQMSETLRKAQEAASKTGEKARVEIKLSTPEGSASQVTGTSATLPAASVQDLTAAEISSLTLSGSLGSVTLDAATLNTVAAASAGDITVSVAKTDPASLSAEAQQAIGERPVYNFSITAGGKTVSRFNGTVTIAIPYVPAAGEVPDAIVIYFINDQGGLETITNGQYNAQTKTVVFTIDHFSQYAVGYHKINFTDVNDNAWYAKAVTHLSARQITSGTADGRFSPDTALTRGQFITLMMRAYNIEADAEGFNNFADAGDTYYTGYLAAAKRLGISNGVGDNRFAPEQSITRQEMFTLLYNGLNALDKLPADNIGKTLADFADSAGIAPYAQKATSYLVKAGTVTGSGAGLDPTGSTTRAQMAQVLYNLLAQ